mgnify:FL=1
MNCIYQAMLRVYTARPEAGQLVLQRFRLANTGNWFPRNIFNQQIDSLENCAVGSLPVQIIFPPFG